MRIAALYDIHGNLPALEAVLAAVRAADVDAIVIGGDVVPGPMPSECLALVQQLDLPVHYLFGNGETAVLTEAAGGVSKTPANFREIVQWSAAQVCPKYESWLKRWPATMQISVDGLGNVLFCHATPRDDSEVFTEHTPTEVLRPIMELPGVDVVVCGHTHMAFDRMVGRVRVVNAGSVGMPFGELGAHWVLLGPDVEFRRTEYDLADAAARIRQSAYPQGDFFAAEHVLRRPGAEEMLANLSAVEIGAG